MSNILSQIVVPDWILFFEKALYEVKESGQDFSLQRYAQFWFNRKVSGTRFATSFSVWFFKNKTCWSIGQ